VPDFMPKIDKYINKITDELSADAAQNKYF
jgi:hypothetical protein